MKDLWDRLEAWAVAHAGRSLRLRPACTPERIAAAEAALGLTFPDDLRATLLVHDGQDGERSGTDDDVFEWLPGCSAWKPLSAIVERWKEERDMAEEGEEDEALEAEGPLYTVLWHPRRIPVAGTPWWDGDNTYVDLVPSPRGTPGQVITFVTECDLVRLGKGLRDALERYLGALERGDWAYDPARRGVSPSSTDARDFANESERFSKYVERQYKLEAKAAKPAKGPTRRK